MSPGTSMFEHEAAAAVAVEAPTLAGFELGEYLGEYRGAARVRRAVAAAERCPELSVAALRAALDELKRATYDTARYKRLAGQLGRLTGRAEEDEAWLAAASQAAGELSREIAARQERARKQNSKRELFRAQGEQVALLLKVGRADEAVRALQDARAFCVDVAEQAQLHVEAARVGQAMGRWLQVASAVQRAEAAVPEPAEDVAAELAAMRAQASFGDAKWAAAVAEIQALSVDRLAAAGVLAAGAVAARDFALYGTLAGLAVLDRDRVRAQLADSARFGQFLDRMPECQRLLQAFLAARYDEALQCLDRIRSFCAIDPVVAPHIAALQQKIVDNVVVLYTRPFVSVRLDAMARALCFASADALEAALVRLIEAGLIPARIDATAGFLVQRAADPRDAALQRAEEIHAAFALQCELMTARVHFLEAESGQQHHHHRGHGGRRR
ncbi:cop9 signalosome complex subunit [Coemansia javaensis]|uniref:Cop9 signalosome complex subunit n=1 Tax=Coemansia javaensis TaxID=2761396 RepID=A0A9W8H3F1_9FUNG|nr:cop9 signalosome complex subunit [Coemansia javaensis]